MSIGGTDPNIKNFIKEEISTLNDMEIIITASASNYETETYYPAMLNGVYSVGGIAYKDNNFVKTDYNNAKWNDFVFLAKDVPIYEANEIIQYSNGTSLSSPAIAGIFALLKQKYSDKTKNELFDILVQNGIRINDVNGIFPVYPIENINQKIQNVENNKTSLSKINKSENKIKEYQIYRKTLTTNFKNYSWIIKFNMPISKNSINKFSIYVTNEDSEKLDFITPITYNNESFGYIKLINNGTFEINKNYYIVIEDSVKSINNEKLKTGLKIKFNVV